MSNQRWFPTGPWPERSPAEAGFDEAKLQAAAKWLDKTAASRYRVTIIRDAHQVAVWSRDFSVDANHGIGSGQKTLYGCMLAIAIEEGKIGSADDRVVDYFPEMMDVPDGRGPKPGRYAIPEDREITFRQLITNTSGYLKPDERPGQKFHYQTFGMNLLTHAIERVYDCYDPTGTARPPGFGVLVQDRVFDRIGVQMAYGIGNFDLPPEARIDIFGNGCGISGPLNAWTRYAYLLRNMGNWDGAQVIPRAWLKEGTRTSELVKAAAPEAEWCYGHGFWCNDYGKRWPGLPRDAFCAAGAMYNFAWICPSLELIVVQNPGGGAHLRTSADPTLRQERTDDQYERELRMLELIMAARNE